MQWHAWEQIVDTTRTRELNRHTCADTLRRLARHDTSRPHTIPMGRMACNSSACRRMKALVLCGCGYGAAALGLCVVEASAIVGITFVGTTVIVGWGLCCAYAGADRTDASVGAAARHQGREEGRCALEWPRRAHTPMPATCLQMDVVLPQCVALAM